MRHFAEVLMIIVWECWDCYDPVALLSVCVSRGVGPECELYPDGYLIIYLGVDEDERNFPKCKKHLETGCPSFKAQPAGFDSCFYRVRVVSGVPVPGCLLQTDFRSAPFTALRFLNRSDAE